MKNEINQLLLEFTRSFLNERMTAEIFSDAYMELWRINRDHFPVQELISESDNEYFLGECIGSLFIACDNYNPELDREEYEYDESALRTAVSALIAEYEEKIAT